jgi:hypothetical protein
VTRDDRNEVCDKALTWTFSNIFPHPAMLATLRTTYKNKGDDTDGSHSWDGGSSMTVKVLLETSQIEIDIEPCCLVVEGLTYLFILEHGELPRSYFQMQLIFIVTKPPNWCLSYTLYAAKRNRSSDLEEMVSNVK